MSKVACAVSDCETQQYTGNTPYCSMHFKRLKRLGTLELPLREKKEFCEVDGCGRRLYARGLCGMHATRLKRFGDINEHGVYKVLKRKEKPKKRCSIEGCFADHHSRGLCKLHYRRQHETGSTELVPYETPRCSIDTCERLAHIKGICLMHYKRVQRGTPLDGNRACVVCSTVFNLSQRHGITCSQPCADENLRSNQRVAIALRRSPFAPNFVETVHRSIVFERDDYTCQICLEPLNMQMKYHSHKKCQRCDTECLRTASLDHIIPIAEGGNHSYANVQAAHLICNIKKGKTNPAKGLLDVDSV